MVVALMLSAALVVAALTVYSRLRRHTDPRPIPVRVRDEEAQRKK